VTRLLIRFVVLTKFPDTLIRDTPRSLQIARTKREPRAQESWVGSLLVQRSLVRPELRGSGDDQFPSNSQFLTGSGLAFTLSKQTAATGRDDAVIVLNQNLA
jgi:hypothetical protein